MYQRILVNQATVVGRERFSIHIGYNTFMHSMKPSQTGNLPIVFLVAALVINCNAAWSAEETGAAATATCTTSANKNASGAKNANSKASASTAAKGRTSQDSVPVAASKGEASQNSALSAASKPDANAGAAQVMDPGQFFGEAQAAYEAAKECPELCANLFCYCGCDITDKHSSLLDCYTSDHSVDCQICRDEVFIALGMKKQGKTLSEIQSAIDDKFAKEYPFQEPSPALMAYRAKKAGKPAPKSTEPANKKSEASPAPKLKAGKKAGNCCGHKG